MKKNKIKDDPYYAREALKYANPIPSREFIIQHLEKSGIPERYTSLVKFFGLKKRKSCDALRYRLNAMLRDGQLLTDRKGRYALVKRMEMLRGYVICHRDGFGFLIPDDGSSDVFLSPRQIRALFPGDQVLVRVSSESKQKKREGMVVEVLERNLTQIVGRYYEEKEFSYIVPVNKNISHEIIVSKKKKGGVKDGQIVVADIIKYPTFNRAATAEITHVLDKKSGSALESEIALNAHGVPSGWSAPLLKEIKSIKKSTIKKEKSNRRGLQNFPFVTIDGDDAKDFDDAVYCEKRKKGGWTLYVAIADVSHFVLLDTCLDKEAFNRGNSVYFPDRVVPMLPELLSNDLCSLKPNEDRLVMVCEMQVSALGRVTSYEFYEGVINSHARLTYDEVHDLLESKQKKSNVLLPHLKELRELYRAFLKQRKTRGALDFARVEAKMIFDKSGKIKELKAENNHYVHGVIEECMLAANVSASKFLLASKIPALYRVHETPDAEKISNLRVFLKALGLELKGKNKPKPSDYAELLQKIIGRPDEHLIQTVLLRSLRQAVYTSKNMGHFGLAYDAYVHFTSPIRRYPDLINHRAIKHILQKKKLKEFKYSESSMRSLGNHCSVTERRADDATRDVSAWLKCDFMKNKVGQVYTGLISGVMSFGIFVELKDIFVEGLVHITSLKNDYYKFDPALHKLVGRRTRKIYRLGDKVKVKVIRVDLEEKEIDFEVV